MTRAQQHVGLWLSVGLSLLALGLLLPEWALFGLSGALGLVGALGVVLRLPYGRALRLLEAKQYDEAGAVLEALEAQLLAQSWRRAAGFLYSGFSTSNALALVRATRGAVRIEQRRYDEAEALLEAALRDDDGYGLAWANRAIAAAGRGDAATAEAHATKARERGVSGEALAKAMAAVNAA